MTILSALSWRACLALCRVHALSAPALSARQRVFGSRSSLLRAHSTETDASLPEATGESDAPAVTASELAATDQPDQPNQPASLIDRLRHVPVRAHGALESIVIKPLTPYPHRREAHNERRKAFIARAQQARLRENLRRPTLGDWRVILRNLISWTPKYTWPQNGIKVIIPQGSTKALLADHDGNVWNIKSRWRCRMTLFRPSVEAVGTEGESEGGDGDGVTSKTNPGSKSDRGAADPYIILTGQPVDLAAAVDDILKVTREVIVVKLQNGTETVLHGGQGEAARLSVSQFRFLLRPKPYVLTQRADEIPKPAEWTSESLQQYIAALTMGRVASGLSRKLYPGKASHQDVVAFQLLSVFKDPKASAVMSNMALKLALRFLVGAGATRLKSAKLIFLRAQKMGLRLDTDVYNIMAETAVKSKNMMAFQSILRLMVKRGQRPNLRTWLLFLRLIEAEEVRRYIIHSMHAKNFFVTPTAVVAVSREMARNDAYRAIQLGQDMATFLAAQRKLYGPAWWLPTVAANKVLDVFARYGKFDEAKQLVLLMLSRKRVYGKPDAVTLNTLLASCRSQNKIDRAIEFIRMFDQHGVRVADHVSFRLLMESARALRKPHLAGAIFRYAHLQQRTSFRLRRRGASLLKDDEEVERITDRIRRLWQEEPGESCKFQCRQSRKEFVTNLLLCDYQRHLAAPTEHGDEAAAANRSPDDDDDSPGEPGEPPIVGQRSQDASPGTYSGFFSWALDQASRWEPAVPLGEFLEAALARDRELHALAHEPRIEGQPREPVPDPLESPPPLPLRPRLEGRTTPARGGSEGKQDGEAGVGAKSKGSKKAESESQGQQSG
ncbi:9bd60c97-7995-4b45-8714-1e9b6eb29be8 [Thermothielavioides terrestris]|uniref:9bd60c97-7995-4b45-8714-1e9b6eb29be8 n=1 Tax=Thermothielavioides terrestris TaxID=2587410 RepID=A0A446BIF9_9PEZI|nr:9bd60c97-7995-4b45-8714-1e9b6eb29be8 [Thermothielavioides terrestris]